MIEPEISEESFSSNPAYLHMAGYVFLGLVFFSEFFNF